MGKSRLKRVEATVNGDNGVPTFTPLQEVDVKKLSNKKVAAIVGGVGAALVVVVIVVIVYNCLIRAKRFTRQTSETGSSLASPPGKLELLLFEDGYQTLSFFILWSAYRDGILSCEVYYMTC